MKSFPSFLKPTHKLTQALVALGVATAAAEAKVVTYQYIRFHPMKLRSSTANVQVSEFYFYNGATQIPASTITVTDQGLNSPASEDPPKASDGTTSTKWLNYTFTNANLVFDFGSPKALDSYNLATANDFIDRDPTGWTIEGSSDGTNWDLLDTQSAFATPTDRYRIFSASNFVIPNVPGPYISAFELNSYTQPAIVANGTPVDLYFETLLGTNGKITRDSDATTINLPDISSSVATVTPPNNRDTVFTFTANNVTAGGTGTSTRTLVLRSVQQQAKSFRYVRYTPKKLRAGGTGIQLQDLEFKNGGTPLTVLPAGAGSSTTAGTNNLIDVESGTPTTWTATTLAPVVLDFGSVSTFDSYSFTTGTASADNDPVQWIIEGSNDGTNWSLFENVSNITYPTAIIRSNPSGDIPVAASVPPSALLSASTTGLVAGESVTLTYSTAGASSISISPGVTTTGTSGTVTLTPSATTTYTLTATDAGGKTTTSSVTVNVVVPTGVINYTNFENATDLNYVATAKTVNDFAVFSNSPNAKRLRLTELAANSSGSAWSYSKMKVKDGFETTFDAHLAFPVYVNGADGIAFTIQNNANKYAAAPNSGLTFTSNAVSVILDSFNDTTGETQANLEIYSTTAGGTTTTMKTLVNLDKNGQAVAKGYQGRYLVTNPTVAPYHVRVVYAPGALSVYIDNKLVLDRYAIDLNAAGAVDSDGKAWVGFSAKTRSIVAYHDVVNWTLTPGAVTTTPLAITNSAFTFGASPQVALTFSSTAGKTYRITTSADLATWTQVGGTTSATTTSTTVNVPFTTGARGFFRVEQVD